jgi:hypothetical protein
MMIRSAIQWASVLALVAFSVVATAADSADTRALSLSGQAQAMLEQKNAGSIRTADELKRRNAIVDAASALQAEIDAGRVRIANSVQLALSQRVDQLQALPVDAALQPRAILANGTISGTVRDAATGLPVSVPNGVRVQAFDFSSQLAPTGGGNLNNVGINASGQYTLSLPPGN